MVKLRVLSFLLLVAPGFGAQTQDLAPPPSSPTAEAQKLLDTGRLEEALKTLDTLAQQQPEPAGVERLRGMALYEQGQIQPSATAFEQAVAQDPGDREAMQMEGVALFRMGKPAAAVPLLEQAHLSIPRTNIDSNYVLGLCYLDTKRYDDARKAFATQYGFPPESPSAYLLAARMLLRRDYLPVADSLALDDTGARWERIASEASGTQFKDATVPGGSVVCYRVRAINAAGESAYSNIARVGR